jgi:phage tail-like protein
MIDLDPLPAFRFFVTLDPGDAHLPPKQALLVPLIAAAGFRSVAGLGGELEVESYAEGGRNDSIHQLPVRHAWGRLTFERGMTLGTGLWEWYSAGLGGSLGARRDGVIVLMTPLGLPAIGWTFRGGLAASWNGPALDATAGNIALESLEIVHEGLVQHSIPGLTEVGAAVSLGAAAGSIAGRLG